MTELPEGWIETRLAELCEFNPKRDPGLDPRLSVSFVPMAAVCESSGELRLREERPLGEVVKGYSHFGEGDVIFAKITPCMENGKVAVARGLTNGLACGSTEFFVLRPREGVEAEYVWRYLRQAEFRAEAAQNMTGVVGQRRVPKAYLEGSSIPLPPTVEQRRIASKLELCGERTRRARGELARVSCLVERQKKCILKAVFDGALTADWREGQESLQPVEVVRSASRRQGRPEGTFSEPYRLPEAWRWVPLPRLGELARGKSRHRPRNDPRLLGGPYPFVQTGDVRAADGWLTKYTATYSEFGLAQSRLWPKGTVCITIAANIAETAILGIDACFPDSVVGFLADDELCSNQYIEYFIRTAKADLEAFAPATAQKNINLNTLSELFVPVPPREEQAIIVERLDRSFAALRQVSGETQVARDRLAQLDEATDSKAFRGELVPQDPHDEPATLLLERIQAAREAESKPKRTRRGKKAAGRA